MTENNQELIAAGFTSKEIARIKRHQATGEHEKPRGSHRMMPSTGVKITTIIS